MAAITISRPWFRVALLLVAACFLGNVSARLLEGGLQAAVVGKDEEVGVVGPALSGMDGHALPVQSLDRIPAIEVNIQRLAQRI